jgi:hypothetical protein
VGWEGWELTVGSFPCRRRSGGGDRRLWPGHKVEEVAGVIGEERRTDVELMEVAAGADPRRVVDAEAVVVAWRMARNLHGSFATAVVGLRAQHARGGDVTRGPGDTTL